MYRDCVRILWGIIISLFVQQIRPKTRTHNCSHKSKCFALVAWRIFKLILSDWSLVAGFVGAVGEKQFVSFWRLHVRVYGLWIYVDDAATNWSIVIYGARHSGRGGSQNTTKKHTSVDCCGIDERGVANMIVYGWLFVYFNANFRVRLRVFLFLIKVISRHSPGRHVITNIKNPGINTILFKPYKTYPLKRIQVHDVMIINCNRNVQFFLLRLPYQIWLPLSLLFSEH